MGKIIKYKWLILFVFSVVCFGNVWANEKATFVKALDAALSQQERNSKKKIEKRDLRILIDSLVNSAESADGKVAVHDLSFPVEDYLRVFRKYGKRVVRTPFVKTAIRSLNLSIDALEKQSHGVKEKKASGGTMAGHSSDCSQNAQSSSALRQTMLSSSWVKRVASRVKEKVSRIRQAKPASTASTRGSNQGTSGNGTPGESDLQQNMDVLALDRKSFEEVRKVYHLEEKERPEYTGYGPRGKINFKFYRVRGDGDCGLHALGVSRGQALDRLRAEVLDGNAEVIDAMKALIYGDLPYWGDKGRDPTVEEMIEYISDRMRHKEFHMYGETLMVLAKLFNKPAQIWAVQADGKLRPTLFSHEKDPALPYSHILHRGDHFDLLVPKDDQERRFDATLREMIWTKMKVDQD